MKTQAELIAELEKANAAQLQAAQPIFDQMRADNGLQQFLQSVGLTFDGLTLRGAMAHFAPYAVYKTAEGDEHSRFQAEIDAKMIEQGAQRYFARISGGNTFDRITIGSYWLTWFPRAGELQIAVGS